MALEIIKELLDNREELNETPVVSYHLIIQLGFKLLAQLVSKLYLGDGVRLLYYWFIHTYDFLNLLIGQFPFEYFHLDLDIRHKCDDIVQELCRF